MSIFGFFKKKADIKPQVEKETAIEAPVQRGVSQNELNLIPIMRIA